MNREELLKQAKPILFNTDMVQAILKGRKTVTRRVVKPQPQGYFEVNENPLYIYDTDFSQGRITPQFQPGDYLYVRETWCKGAIDCGEESDGKDVLYVSQCEGEDDYILKAHALHDNIGIEDVAWKPSIHMPKEAARIFLKVTDIRVERLQECGKGWCLDIEKEGVVTPQAPILYVNDDEFHEALREEFHKLWDSTIKKADLDKYGWEANPWVWVIEFERVEV